MSQREQHGPWWPCEPLVWRSRAVLVIASALCNCCQAAQQQDTRCLHQAKRQWKHERKQRAWSLHLPGTWNAKKEPRLAAAEATQVVTDLHLPQMPHMVTVRWQSALAHTEASAQVSLGMFLATPGLELKGGSKVVAGCSASAALGCQRSDWERKEGEVNPACRKTASSLRVASAYVPAAAASQSATSAGSDRGTT